MADVGKYDTREAAHILGVARMKTEHDAQEGKALEGLLGALRDAAIAAGYSALLKKNVLVDSTFLHVSWAPRVGCTFGEKGGRPGVAPSLEPTAELRMIEGIEFDPISGIFVGTEPDEHIVPTPGEPKARRSAVAVAADHIIRLMNASSKPAA